jgi:hypothetical protein
MNISKKSLRKVIENSSWHYDENNISVYTLDKLENSGKRMLIYVDHDNYKAKITVYHDNKYFSVSDREYNIID